MTRCAGSTERDFALQRLILSFDHCWEAFKVVGNAIKAKD
jgi:hypothetical protein